MTIENETKITEQTTKESTPEVPGTPVTPDIETAPAEIPVAEDKHVETGDNIATAEEGKPQNIEHPVPSGDDSRDDQRDRGYNRDRGGRDGGSRDGGYRGGGRDGGYRGRSDRPLTNEDKLRRYKKQSEERLLDIKRSKENKVGKKKK
ncbi:MAG: hypothetical protein NTY09_10920 [bacterium]|nr:hypothetical protein [bacterium]